MFVRILLHQMEEEKLMTQEELELPEETAIIILIMGMEVI